MGSKKDKKRRRGKRESGAERHDKSREQHSGGGGEWDAIRIPEGLEVFKPEAKETYHIDIIPTVAGPHNQAAREGYEWWEFSYPVYNNIGIDEKRFIAIKDLLGEADPIAEHFAALRRKDVDWDDMKDFKAKQRQMMLVFVHEQADKGLQFFEGAYGTFGELLREEIDADDSEHVQNLDDTDGGATVVVRFKSKNIGQKNPWVLAGKINFIKREDGFDADGDSDLAELILDKAAEITLDDCLKIPTYKQLKAALDGSPEPGDDESEDSPSEPTKGRKERKGKKDKKGKKEKAAPPEDEPESEDSPSSPEEEEAPAFAKGDKVEHDEHGASTITRVAKDKKTCTLKDVDGDIQKGVPMDELRPATEEEEPESEDSPSEPPKKAKGKGKGKSKGKGKAGKKEKASGKDGGEDDDWDEDWD